MLSALIGEIVYKHTDKLSNDEAKSMVDESTEVMASRIRLAEINALQLLLRDENLKRQLASENITLDE